MRIWNVLQVRADYCRMETSTAGSSAWCYCPLRRAESPWITPLYACHGTQAVCAVDLTISPALRFIRGGGHVVAIAVVAVWYGRGRGRGCIGVLPAAAALRLLCVLLLVS